MAKYLDQTLPQTFKDSPKSSHFTQDYVIVCEKDLLVSSLGLDYTIWGTPGGDGFSNTHSPWWIQAFDTHGGIPTLDPFRAKTLRYWIATRAASPGSDTIIKPSKINSSKPYIMTSTTGGDFLKGGIPVQLRVANTSNINQEIKWDVVQGTSFNNNMISHIKTDVTSNPYGVRIIENIDFTVTRDDSKVSSLYSVQQRNGIICAVAGSFLDPSLSIENYDPETGDNVLQIPTQDYTTYLHLSAAGMPAWNNSEGDLLALSDITLSKIFNPSAYKTADLPLGMEYGGKFFHTSAGDMGDAYDTRGAYRDATFALPTLVSSQAIEAVDGLSEDFDISGQGAYYADIDPVYNYLSSKYETDIVGIHHTKLPNIYDYMKQLESAEALGEDTGATVSSGLKSIYLFQSNNENKHWASYIDGIDNPSVVNPKQYHIFVSNQGNYAPSVIDEYKDNFPMYNEISFRSHSGDQAIMGALKGSETSTDLWKSIIKHMFHKLNLNTLGEYEIRKNVGGKFSYSPYSADGNGGVKEYMFKAGVEENVIISQTKQNGQTGIKYNYESDGQFGVFNFDKWIENLQEGDVDELIDGGLVQAPNDIEEVQDVLQAKDEEFNNKSSMFIPPEKPYKNPLLIIFKSIFKKVDLLPEIAKIVQQKTRTHSQLFDGEKAHSEILYYRIQKILNGDTVQNFWIENTPGNDVLKYVDTQIKYGDEFEYRIHAYAAVIGTKYHYTSNAEVPKFIDYFTPSPTSNPLDWDMPHAYGDSYEKAISDYNINRAPTGFKDGEDLNPNKIIYPFDMQDHKERRWQEYVQKYPAFAALNAEYMIATSSPMITGQSFLLNQLAQKNTELEEVSAGQTLFALAAKLTNYKEDLAAQTSVSSGAGIGIGGQTDAEEEEYTGPNQPTNILGGTGGLGDDDDSNIYSAEMLKQFIAEIEAQIQAMQALFTEINELEAELEAMTALSVGQDTPQKTKESVELLKAMVGLEAETDVLYAYESSNEAEVVPGTGGDKVPNQLLSRIQTVSEPYIKILEVPMFSETVTVVDDPPLAPHVTFNGFVGVNNKIMFSFDNSVGEELAVPVMLGGEDPNTLDKIRRKQDRDYTYNDTEFKPENKSAAYVKQKITYRADDFASEYQVFRKFSQPTSPNDFDMSDMIVSLNTENATSFVDNISPNTEIYYMFRAVDKHGHTSNPTVTYKVQIVDDDGAIYVLVEAVDYERERAQDNKTKPFKKYLQLDPAFLQKLINENETDFGNSNTASGIKPVIGVLADSVYDNKKFKIRVTSRGTGKKVDINLEFKKEMDEKSLLEQPDIF